MVIATYHARLIMRFGLHLCNANQSFIQVIYCSFTCVLIVHRSIRVAERLALPTSDHGVTGSNPAGGEILPEPKRRFIAQSLSCSPFHRLQMTEILSKGRKTLTHPSIIVHLQGPIIFLLEFILFLSEDVSY